MQGLKVSLSSAAFGFLLSLLFGISSKGGIWIFIHALIFALVFAALGFLIFFLSNKFLLDDSDSDLSVETASGQTSSPVGSKVDLYVRDEELTDEENENAYFVDDSSYQMLNPSDSRRYSNDTYLEPEKSANIAGTGSVSESDSAEDAKKQMAAQNAMAASNTAEAAPQKKSENNDSESQDPMALLQNAGSTAPVSESASADENKLDTLPDMTSFVVEGSSQKSDDDVPGDSDSSFSNTVTAGHKDPAELAGKSAEVMAKAISSVLSAETED